MKVIIFDVEHGFCAFIKSPNGYGLMIDCGRRALFSPVTWIVNNEATNLSMVNGHQLAQLIVSHPHDDHLQDISSVRSYLKPATLLRQHYDWTSLKDPSAGDEYENLDEYNTWQQTYNRPATNPDWGMWMKVGPYLSPDDAKKVNETDYVNNSSIPVFIEYKGLKFTFSGDLMASGWQKLLEQEALKKNLSGTGVFVTSHHGHNSGFCSDVYLAMGKPELNVVSAHRRDQSVDPRYSSDEYAKGCQFQGERRKMLSTRNDGTIVFEYTNNGWGVYAQDL